MVRQFVGAEYCVHIDLRSEVIKELLWLLLVFCIEYERFEHTCKFKHGFGLFLALMIGVITEPFID